MLLQILRKGHGFEHNLLVEHRGIEQVESVFLPHGEAEVSNVEPLLLAGDGDDVTVAHCLAQQTAVRDNRLGDISELRTRYTLLHPTDLADIFRMFTQGLITIGVRTHIIDVDRLKSLEGRIRCLDLSHDTLVGVGRDPLGEVMDAAGVAVGPTLTITHVSEGIKVSLPGILATIGTECESRDILNERGAVELTGIHNQSLGAELLERVGHIGYTQELTGKEEWQIRGLRLLTSFSEQSAYGRAIDLLIVEALSCPGVDRDRQKQTE